MRYSKNRAWLVGGVLALLTLAPLALVLALGGGCRREQQATKPTETNANASSAPSAESAAAPAAAPAPSASRHTTDPKPPDDAPRVYAKTRFVWVHAAPGVEGWIGFLWFGGSVKLRECTICRYAPGCAHWVAVEPRGYVCLDGGRATLDAGDPMLATLRNYAPRLNTAWPHHYAESRGAQLYRRMPTRKQQLQREWDLVMHEQRIAEARRGKIYPTLLGVDLTPATAAPFELGPLPPTIHENRRRLRPQSTVAYSTQVQKDGRAWLLSADMRWVPKDRVAPYPKVEFKGVKLGEEAKLPLAFFRSRPRPKYAANDDGGLIATGASFQRLSWVELSGKTTEQDGTTYLQTREPGIFVAESDTVVPKPQRKTPWGAPVGGKDETGITPPGRATWLEASVLGGWLLAYEGTRPVYATMISPGRGGTPVPGKDPLETASTPTGTFKITGKFATATMVAPHEFIHSDVPWAQNFHGPHALHAAYWHNDWGQRKSGGCVNVSPLDGRYLYEFTEPVVPKGWHGVRWQPKREPATTFVVHR